MNTGIQATSITLREVINDKLAGDVNLRSFFHPHNLGATMIVSLLAPEVLAAQNEGVSIWLYRVSRDDQTLNQPPRRSGRDRMLHVPLPLRLHYLIVPVVNATTRSNAPELEQNILGAVMQVLYDKSILRGGDLQGDFTGSSLELHARLETLDLDELSRMWEALEQSFRLCVSYEVAVVPIDSSFDAELQPAVDAVVPTSGIITAEEAL